MDGDARRGRHGAGRSAALSRSGSTPSWDRAYRRPAPRSSGRLDEDDVRVRPGRGSRPRTRTRPRHEDAEPGTVVAVDRGRYAVLVGDTRVTAVQARELGRGSVVVGDRVAVVGDLSGGPDSLARIVRVEPRRTVLRRSADDTDPYERVIVANADQLVVVTPLLCLTKADLASPDELLAAYADLGTAAVATRRGGDGAIDVGPLRDRLRNRASVLVGHSGVGKSTLVNELIPDAQRAVGEVSAAGRGRHTSSSAVALPLPESGWVIDTPGIRSFGLAHITAADLLGAFPDLAEGAEECPPNCAHRSAADGCHLDEWVAEGHSTPGRLASFRRLLEAKG
jgi:ribosome biogenesis GTPase